MLSLIVTTRDTRAEQFSRFLKSINAQTEHTRNQLELIIVNQDKALPTQQIHVKHKIINTTCCSLSKARNIGLTNISSNSEIVGFPDDDCWYNDSILKVVMQNINDLDFLCTGVYDPYLKKTYGRSRRLNRHVRINLWNSLRIPISVGIFVKTEAIVNQFEFDERYGAGTEWGSGEESDLILFLLHNGKKGEYYSFDKVYHELEEYKSSSHGRTLSYAKGYGALITKSMCIRSQYSLLFIFVYVLLRTLITYLLFAYKKHRRDLYLCRLKGLILGFKAGVDYYHR